MGLYLGSYLKSYPASFRKTPRLSRFAFAPAIAALLSASSALASQGPGGGPGTANSFTQLTMAIVVYVFSALVVGGGPDRHGPPALSRALNQAQPRRQ